MPTPEVATALRVGSGTPVLALLWVAYDVKDVPLAVCDTVMSSDRYLQCGQNASSSAIRSSVSLRVVL